MAQAAAPSKGLMQQATKAAETAKARADIGNVVSGPFDVGNIGTVSVVERPSGNDKHLYAVYQPHSGRTQRIPLAAVATLAGALD